MNCDSSSKAALVLMIALAGCSSSRPAPVVQATPKVSRATPTPIVTPFPRTQLERIFRKYSQKTSTQLGIVVMRGTERAGVGEDRSYEAASLIKLPILAEYLAQVGEGRLRGDATMNFEERFRVGGSGKIKHGPVGKGYPLATLAEVMITESDNVATDMLLEKLGLETIEKRARSLGLRHTTVRRKIMDFAAIDKGRDNLTTPADMATLLGLWQNGRLPGSQEALRILNKQKRNDVMTALLPREVAVAHKTGQLTGFLHDAGIVFAPTGGYIMVVMSQGGDADLGKLGAEVFQVMNLQSGPAAH